MMSLVRPDKEREIDTLDKVYTRLMLGDRAVQNGQKKKPAPSPATSSATRQQQRRSARLIAKRDRIKQHVDEKKQIR